MNDSQDIQALTNQRVTFELGGKIFSARRGTVGDAGRAAKFTAEKRAKGDDANLEIEANLYTLSECMKPDFDYTYEQLAEMIPFSELLKINEIMEKLGFQDPRLQTQNQKKK